MSIPKRLRQAIRLRQRALFTLREASFHGLGFRVVTLAKRVTDLNRYIQQREWLARVQDFDPIALGM